MWSDSNGREQVFPWGDTPAAPYAVGDTVYSDTTAGRVVSLGDGAISVVWSDGDGGAIVYPSDATYLRKAMPWES